MTTNTSRWRPGVRSMTRPRYFDRRRDRDQNGVAGGFPAPPADPFGDSERVRLTAFGQLLPVVGRDAGGGGPPWRTGGCAPLWRSAGCAPLVRTGGCAGPRAPVPVPAPPLRAQPAEGPLAGGAPCGDGGSGGGRPAAGADPRVRPLPPGDVAVRGGHAGHPLGDGGACRRDTAGAARRRAVGRPAGVRGATPGPARRGPGAHAWHDDTRRARGHPAEAEGRTRASSPGRVPPRRACRSRPRRTGAGTACGR